jgi:hypothetical protein
LPLLTNVARRGLEMVVGQILPRFAPRTTRPKAACDSRFAGGSHRLMAERKNTGGASGTLFQCDPGETMAVTFDGSSAYLEVGNLDAASLTFAAWVKFDSPYGACLINSANSGGWCVEISPYYGGLGILKFSGISSGFGLYPEQDPIWHFVAVTYDATAEDLTFYFDDQSEVVHDVQLSVGAQMQPVNSA